MRIIWAFVGVVVGIAGCIAFAKVYHNYNASSPYPFENYEESKGTDLN